MGFGPLRVINDDTVAPGAGFPPHSHRDMEIISYVLEGALEHRDSMGTGSVIRPGDLQRMSAGRGVTHSEYNASKEAPVHFLQIWLVPTARGLAPGYAQKHFSDEEKRDRLCLLASPDGAAGSVSIAADARLYAALVTPRGHLTHVAEKGRKGWLHVAQGTAEVNALSLAAGDGLAIEDEPEIAIASKNGGEVLLFDLGG